MHISICTARSRNIRLYDIKPRLQESAFLKTNIRLYDIKPRLQESAFLKTNIRLYDIKPRLFEDKLSLE
jgi:hypothetical protein